MFAFRNIAARLGALTTTLAAIIALGGTAHGADLQAKQEVLAKTVGQRCVKCHGKDPDELSGDVDLRVLQDAKGQASPDLLRKAIEAIEFGAMPPEDEPVLEVNLQAKLIEELTGKLHQAISTSDTMPHTPMRRMNRFQYNNAVIDLFQLRCIVFTLPERMMRDHGGYFKPDTGKMAEVVNVGSRPLGKSQMIEARLIGVAAFPQDLRAENGFDNRGDHLSLSPLLMAEFLKVAKSIVDSRDFGPRNVGIWKQFFAPPESQVDVKQEVRRRLETFLTHAFRRPVEADVLDRYARYVGDRIDSGADFTETMKAVAAAAISSPKFLYLYDRPGDEDRTTSIDDFELASRLSFFLWGSIPDQTLLDLAAQDQLHLPEVLEKQIDRMLRDEKLKRFCDTFPSQWLQLERIISSVPDQEAFPGFYFSKYRDSMHMMLEPLLVFETVLIEDLPITQLIDSDFTYRSTHLENSYGDLATEKGKSIKERVSDVTVLKFHRVPVTDRRNGGVITNAAVMTMTSGPKRTKPISRGAWIASVIFNNPPEPPPADVPPLAEKPQAGEETLTLRERLSLHRERADCRGCHEQIDPLGFALENYNPIGKWREKYENQREVDVSGKLFGKHEFADVVQFKDAILSEKKRFARALAGHLLSFGLAREFAPSDQLALDKIVEATAADDYKMKTLLRQVMLSQPFLSKRNSLKPPGPQVSKL
ncbi:DUF1592 domain-containing protein [bacterium]|nr:DUF1592 domain-containing protein [bacterium]